MVVLAFYEKKHNKVVTNDYIEIDLIDLESFGDYEEHIEFSKTSRKTVGKKTIIEWFAVNNISFWWFIYPVIYPKFNEAALFINRFFSFLDRYSIKTIKLHGNYDKLDIIKEICEVKNIQFKISKKYFLFVIKKLAENLVKKAVYKKITTQKHKKRLNCYTHKKKFQPVPLNSTIITSPGIYRRNMTDYESGETKKQEFILQPILDLLHKNNMPTLCFDLDYTFRGDLTSLIERLDSKFNWVPIEILLNESKSVHVRKSIKILHDSFEQLKKNNMNDVFVHRNISLWKYLEPSFKQIFLEPYLPTYLHLIEKIEEFFMLIKPQVIIQVYETGPYAKSFEIIAKKLRIKTIGIQHGIIYEGNPDYVHEEIQDENNLGYPMPDLTFVFGEYYKKILTEKCHYPKDNVIVIGNPSFYNIDKLKRIMNKELILKKYNLEDKKTILVPLSFRLFYYSKNSIDDLLLDTLFNGLKKNDDIIVLIRPHPGDSSDIETKLEQKYPSKNFKISKGSLVEDIFISDIVVTTISTVGVDAVIFEKPVIFVNIAGSASESLGGIQKEMIENEVAISISRDELILKILSIQKGQLWETEKSSKRKEFMHSYFSYVQSVDLMKLIYSG
ncbi:MAG: CDP-glycerol glycerophosphotransferase family protein [Nitrososphaeraceae archaeon]